MEIEEGRSEKLEVREGDNARELAVAFCVLHGLEQRIVTPLARHIQESAERVTDIQERKEARQRQQQQQQQQQQQRPSTAPTTGPRAPKPSPSASTSNATPVAVGASDEDYHSEEGTGADDSGVDVHSRLYNHAKQLDKRRKEAAAPALSASQQKKGAPGFHQPRAYAGAKGLGFINRRDNTLNRSMNGDFRNFGERLYVEGVVAMEQRKLRAENAQSERQALEAAELRESPQISELARRMQAAEGDARGWERLANEGSARSRRGRMAAVRRELDNREVKECSFKPKISSRSKALMRDRMSALKEHNIPYHEQLFHDAERRRLMQEEVSNWFPEDHTFHPNNSLTQHHVSPASATTTTRDHLHHRTPSGGGNASSVRKSLDAAGQEQLIARLTRRSSTTHEKLQHMKELEAKVDLESGQALFKPRTGRAPIYERNRAKLPIGEYLYGLRYEFDDKKEFMMEQEMRRIEEEAASSKANMKSNALMRAVMRRRFEAVFVFLDKASENAVDLERVDLSLLDDEVKLDVVETRNTVKREREDGSALVDKEEFVVGMTHTVKHGARRHPRTYLFSTAHRRVGDAMDDHMNPSFHPRVNKRSQKLAGSRRVDGVPVEAALMQSKMDAESRVEQRRIELERKKMAECTFKPKLNLQPSPSPSARNRPTSAPLSEGRHTGGGVDDLASGVDHIFGGTRRRASELERLAFGDDKDFEQLELELDMHADPVEMEQVHSGRSIHEMVSRSVRNALGSYSGQEEDDD